MPFWSRRRETLNERLMREAGLDPGTLSASEHDAGPADLEDSWFDQRAVPFFDRLSGEITSARPRRWDAVVSADAPKIDGEEVEFAALPDGSLIVEDDAGEGDLTPLADAIEAQVPPPYRARGVKQGESVWAVAARRIQVATFHADGEEVELSMRDGTRSLSVDGAPEFGGIPALERIGEGEGPSYVVRARRLDGDTWEVHADPL